MPACMTTGFCSALFGFDWQVELASGCDIFTKLLIPVTKAWKLTICLRLQTQRFYWTTKLHIGRPSLIASER